MKAHMNVLETWLGEQNLASMPRGRGTLVYTEPPAHLDCKDVQGKKHIVFVSYYPNVTAIKQSWMLRRSGRYYTTLIACCIREDAEIEKFFDQYYEVHNYADMRALLLRCVPHKIHAHIQPGIIGALAVVCSRQTDADVIIHVNDALLFVEADVRSEFCLLEREILRHSAAFTHKMPSRAIAELRRIYALDRPDACIHALPVPDFCVTEATPCVDDALRLVFAGGVMPYHLAVARGHENHILDPLIEQCGRAGYELTVLVNPNARNMYWHEHEHYFELERRVPHFHFVRGMALQHVPAYIAGRSCGLHYENRPICSYNPKHFEYNMATKVFSYIEAGLPVLVSDSAPYIVEFIEKHGLGFGFSFVDFNESLHGLRHFDLAAYAQARAIFLKNCTMYSNLPILESLYEAAHA